MARALSLRFGDEGYRPAGDRRTRQGRLIQVGVSRSVHCNVDRVRIVCIQCVLLVRHIGALVQHREIAALCDFSSICGRLSTKISLDIKPFHSPYGTSSTILHIPDRSCGRTAFRLYPAEWQGSSAGSPRGSCFLFMEIMQSERNERLSVHVREHFLGVLKRFPECAYPGFRAPHTCLCGPRTFGWR